MNFWTEKEFKTFIEYVTYPTHQLIFTTLFYTELRKSELFDLKYSDIHGNELHLSETVKRTGDEYIFKPSLYSHINRDLDNWIRKVGTKRIRIHDFRHRC